MSSVGINGLNEVFRRVQGRRQDKAEELTGKDFMEGNDDRFKNLWFYRKI
jgi:hypothetical protein